VWHCWFDIFITSANFLLFLEQKAKFQLDDCQKESEEFENNHFKYVLLFFTFH